MPKSWKRAELDTADAIREAGLDPDADRLGAGRQNRKESGRDIITPSLPWCIEVSSGKGKFLDVCGKLEEAEAVAREGEYPMHLAERRNGRGVPRDRLVVLREQDFLDLMQLIDW